MQPLNITSARPEVFHLRFFAQKISVIADILDLGNRRHLGPNDRLTQNVHSRVQPQLSLWNAALGQNDPVGRSKFISVNDSVSLDQALSTASLDPVRTTVAKKIFGIRYSIRKILL